MNDRDNFQYEYDPATNMVTMKMTRLDAHEAATFLYERHKQFADACQSRVKGELGTDKEAWQEVLARHVRLRIRYRKLENFLARLR
jgi:hypothetical protein